MISVIIPLYNKEAIIERTLRSVLSQDYDDYEVIIVDDGSTDKSLEICKRELPRMCHELSKNPQIVTFVQQENGGPSKARNTGIYAARGEWYYLIDADDEILPGTLKALGEKAKEYPEADMILGEVIFNCEGKIKKGNHYKEGFIKNIFREHYLGLISQCSGSTLYKSQTTSKILFNDSIRRFEDLERLFRLYRFARIYTTQATIAQINTEYAFASKGRNDIKEDFLGYIDFKGKSFWEKMSLYKFYIWERALYKEQVKCLYPYLKWRYDLFLCYKYIPFLKKIFLNE